MRVKIIEPTKRVAPRLKRVCAYARVSSASEAQGDSLENQTTYNKQLIENNPEYIFAGIFADYDSTGTKDDRPEFQKMLAMAREHKIDRILTKSVSRFARNTTIMIEVVRELKSLGVEVIFEKENISTFDGDGELMLTVLSSFAQEESKNVSDNIKWQYRRKFEQGELAINTTRFLGYDKDEYGDLIINRSQAKIVERIFNDCVNGKGTFVIAKELTNEGVQTVAGGSWHSSTILAILRNEKYKGDVKLQKTYSKDHLSKKKCTNHGEVDSYYIENNHSSIVTKEIWEEAQRKIHSRGEAKGNLSERKYQNRYPLTGMLICSKCLDSKGEVLLSILSSLAQDESRSISENSTWGIRRRFEQGKLHINHVKFLGYDKDVNGSLTINTKQAKTVRRIYRDFLDGKGANRIAKELEDDSG